MRQLDHPLKLRASALAAGIAMALLAGCGGGGGGGAIVRPDPPRPAICNDPAASNNGQPGACVYPPPPPPPPPTCQDPNARNFGQPGNCIPRYRGVQDNVLVPINADRVHAQGITGAGVRIGFLDGAPRPDLPGFSVYEGRYNYYRRDDLTTPNIAGGADTDHGHSVAMTIVGRRTQITNWPTSDFYFEGGVAPGARLEWLRYCAIPEGTPPGGIGLCGGFTRPTYDFMHSLGVTIINHSYGGQSRWWENPQEADLVRNGRDAIQPAIDRDMLLLYAGGNLDEESVNFLGGTPYYYPDHRGNILVVVGANLDAQGNVSGIAASRCMVTAQWCITAPYSIMRPGGPDGRPVFVAGTSHSVAIVSGVAALVSQVYPWMGGRNLQTTILTTATDIGEPGVDPVYGWGLVNAERAVRGPAQFLDNFVANVNREGSWTFHNDISGPGSLTVRGIGMLRLAGNNTYAGLTDIQGGNLALSGRIAGDVRNAGTFTSNGGRIGGTYTALPGSTTAIEVGRGLEIGGTANLDGTLRLLAPTNPQYQVRDRERVLWAGLLNGRFAGVTVGSGFFYSATLDYTATDVFANLVRQSAAAAAEAYGAKASAIIGGARMDALLDWLDHGGGNDALRRAAFSIAATPDAESSVRSLASLAGEVHGTARIQAIEQSQGDAAVIADRAFDVREATDEPASWVQVVGRNGTLKSDGFADADLRSSGLIIGTDADMGDAFRVGAALSHSKATGDLDDLAGDFNARRTGIVFYGVARGEDAYVTATLGFDRLSVDTARTIDLGAQGRHTVRSDRRDRVAHLRVEAGMEAKDGLIPYAALGALRHRQGAFAETGADGLGLAARSDTHTVTYGETGLRLNLVTDGGAAWRGFLGGRWTLSGRDVGYTATFAGAPEVTFATNGQRLPSGVMRAGLGYFSADKDGWQWFAEGVVEGTSDGLRDGRIGVGVRWTF
jgi:autotransporter-associated beta strand protein